MSEVGAFAATTCVVRRDLLLALRRRSDVLSALFFFVIVVSLFPLGVGPEMATLRTMQPNLSITWIERHVPYTARAMPHFVEGMRKAGLD